MKTTSKTGLTATAMALATLAATATSIASETSAPRSITKASTSASAGSTGIADTAPLDPALVDFIDRFAGDWSGRGEVLRHEDGSTRQVACEVTGATTEETARTEGRCRAMVIFVREIASDITLGPDGVFRGVYTGADNGAAELVGKLDGDTLVLDMTYEQPIHGDTEALMKITNADDGTYSVSVYDTVAGEEKRVSRIEFKRKPID